MGRGPNIAGRRFLGVLLLLALPAQAAGTLDIDAATLNELLPVLTPREVEVALSANRALTVELYDLKVTGFDPSGGGETSEGQILTQVSVRIPDLGIEASLSPRLSLRVVEVSGESLLELRFDEAEVPLPLLDAVNIGKFIPPLRFPAESVFLLEGPDGEVPMRSRLTGVKMGLKALRFEFELERN